MKSENFGAILAPIIIKALPQDLILDFNKTEKKCSYNLNRVLEFLSEQLIARERSFPKLNQKHFPVEKQSDNMRRDVPRKFSHPVATSEKFLSNVEMKEDKDFYFCLFCGGKHKTNYCKKAENMSNEEKINICKEKGACFKCFLIGHKISLCKNKINCLYCGRDNHASIMCFHKNKSEPKGSSTEDSNLSNNHFRESVCLQTLIVNISEKGKSYLIRAVIDSGSSRTYISEFISKHLKLKSLGKESVVHGLFGGIEKTELHNKYKIHLGNLERTYDCEMQVMDQKIICSNIPKLNNSKHLNKLRNYGIRPSDVIENEKRCLFQNNPNEIHLLIGADYAGKLFTGEIKNIDKNLVAMKTRLGWTVLGKSEVNENPEEVLLSLHVTDRKINDLWSLDSLGITEPALSQTKKEIEKTTEQHFIQNLKRNHEGRYEVSLPWLEAHPELPDNRKIAEKRLNSCIKTLKAKNCLTDYENVFNDWVAEEIIEPVKCAEKENIKCHYLPHRPIFREKSTTPIRPIFDASAKEKNAVSLNDCIEKGPNYIELIPRIINRFRMGKYGVISDIRRAFLQISLNPTDRDFLRFLWWEGGDPSKLKIFRHKTIVFGVNASPYLLAATIKYHLDNVPKSQKEIASKLKESMYVDNCVASVESVEELNAFIDKSTEIMATAKFDLRGWKHNKTEEENSVLNLCSEEFNAVESLLGLKWNLINDTLSCDVKEDSNHKLSKRIILSILGKIFDPIGFTSPVTLVPKLILQECWKLKINWDADLPEDLKKKFIKWLSQLICLKEIEIPRKLPTIDKNTSLQVFCDASKKAYATCIFIRHSFGGKVNCQLVQSRARVAPIKPITIPRLEILACTIGARLAQTVKDDLKLHDVPVFYWTDSTNALFWIKKRDNWATFVANRVNEIRNLSDPDDWHHIPGKFNIADLPSRGCGAEELKRSEWWKGPKWIYLTPEEWPSMKEEPPDFDVINRERKKVAITASNNTTVNKMNFFDRISKYEKIVRILAWIMRFLRNIKVQPPERTHGSLNVEEIKKSETTLFKMMQEESFDGLQDKKIRTLRPVLDSHGVMRVKTRIFQRNDTEDFLFPILLPSDHHLVIKLIRAEHENLNHAGIQFVMCSLRERFWIIKSRKTIRKVIKQCVHCQKFDSVAIETVPASLPEDRVREALIFEIVGVDLAGPLLLKGGQKTWIVLFTCAVFRAVHLELVSSLSTDGFLQAFRRFVYRRGRPITVYSDNGKNFIGSDNLFKSIDWNIVFEEASVKRIDWKFIPPSAPWWGGWWERLIGVLKRILRKVIGKTSLNYEELMTVICDCENIMNNRPLTYMSEDVEDMRTITPAMFLKELPSSGTADLDFLDSESLRRRYIHRAKIVQDLRKRFRKEYLGQLRQSSNFVKAPTSVKIGDIVLVTTNEKRLNWPLAKVLEIFPSADGEIRLVKLKTSQGTLMRPTKSLIPLEFSSSPVSEQRVRTRLSRASISTQ